MKRGIVFSFILLSFAIFAQEIDKNIPKGNEAFVENKFADAEANYRVSHSKAPQNAVATYNLGNAIYKQNQAEEAKLSYLKALENSRTREEKSATFHNLGNVFMKEKDYTKAVAAFKNALRNNPEDEETRYNFALAKKMLKDNPPKKDDKKEKKKDDKKDKKDDKKDKKDDKKDGDKDKKDNKGKGDKPDQKPQPKPGGISKERLQNLMDAVNNEEKKVQDKVNAQKVKGKRVQTEKDW